MFVADDELERLQTAYLNSENEADNQRCIKEKERLLVVCGRLLEKCNRLRKLWILEHDRNYSLNEEFDEIILYINGMIERLNSMKRIG